MSWDRFEIKNWQSLRNIDLTLGHFTVIVGPTSSGKSALIRAVKALASNVRGAGYISVGSKKASISATLRDTKVTLERGETTGSYKIVTNGNEVVFTKLAGSVPEQVTTALNFSPVGVDIASTNFAGQHDAPFLLGDSGSHVARVLGELTNVSKIFEAVREANRRKQNTSTALNLRKKDLDSVKSKVSEFQEIRNQILLMSEIEESFKEAQRKTVSKDRLSFLVSEYEEFVEKLSSYEALPELPNFDEINSRYQTYRDLKDLMLEFAQASKQLQVASQAATMAKEEWEQSHETFHNKMRDAGQCPLCGNEVT